MTRSRRSVVQFLGAVLVLILEACAQEPTAPEGKPAQVIAQRLAAGSGHTCALASSGAAYCWGGYLYGELGTGSTPRSTIPVAVSGGLSFSALAARGGVS